MPFVPCAEGGLGVEGEYREDLRLCDDLAQPLLCVYGDESMLIRFSALVGVRGEEGMLLLKKLSAVSRMYRSEW